MCNVHTSFTWAWSSWLRLRMFLMVSSLSVLIMILSMWISLDRYLFSFFRSSHSCATQIQWKWGTVCTQKDTKIYFWMFQLSQIAKKSKSKKKSKRQHINGKVLKKYFFLGTENDLFTNYFSHLAYMSTTWGPSQNIWETNKIQI